MWYRFKSFPFLPAVILLSLNVRMVTSGLTWVGVTAFVIAVLWFGFEFTKWLTSLWKTEKDLDDSVSEDSESCDQLISLVYFLSESRTSNESSIRSTVASAIGESFDSENPDAEHFVLQFQTPESSRDSDDGITRFMVQVSEGLFAILVSDSPYIENPEQFAEQSIRDKRLRSAIELHCAWLSVDLMEDSVQGKQRDEAYRVIGKILAAFAGPDCLAVYSPELQRCNEFDISLLETLSGGSPLDLFDEPTFEPIVEISDSDSKMAAAVKTAISRWPEFVEKFEKASQEEREKFIVKAEFREESACEFMWVSVTEISQDSVKGILMNDPHELLDVHRGAPVSFALSRLNDWIYSEPNERHIGGFTLDVLAEVDDD